jgi:hypothetical protein
VRADTRLKRFSTALESAGSLGIAEAARIDQIHIITLFARRRRFEDMTPTTTERVRILEANACTMRRVAFRLISGLEEAALPALLASPGA